MDTENLFSSNNETNLKDGPVDENELLAKEAEKWKKKLDMVASQKDAIIKNYAKQLFELQNNIIQLRNEKQTLGKEKEMLQESLSQPKKDLLQKSTNLFNQNAEYCRRIVELEKKLGITPTVAPPPADFQPLSFSTPRSTTPIPNHASSMHHTPRSPIMTPGGSFVSPRRVDRSPSRLPGSQEFAAMAQEEEFQNPKMKLDLTGLGPARNANGAVQTQPQAQPKETKVQVNDSYSDSESESESENPKKQIDESSRSLSPSPSASPENNNNSKISNNKQDSSAFEALALELAIHRRLARIVYENDHVMDEISSDVTRATVELFDWLSTEDTFVSAPKYFNTLTKVIQGVATKRESLNTIDINCYWLSTVSSLYLYIQKNPQFEQFSKELEVVIRNIYDALFHYFLQVVSPNLISIFCQSQSTEPTFTPRKPPMSARLRTSSVNSSPSQAPGNTLYSARQRRNHPVLIAMSPLINNNALHRWDIDDLATLLSDLLLSFRKYPVPIKLVQKLFESFMASINRLMINSLMSCKELCTAANGFQIKLALSRIEEWLEHKNVKIYVGNSAKKLKMLSEAATVLTLDKAVLVNDNSIILSVCPSLNIYQIKQLVVSFQPDSIVAEPVPAEVINTITHRCKAVDTKPILIGEEIIKPLEPHKLILTADG